MNICVAAHPFNFHDLSKRDYYLLNINHTFKRLMYKPTSIQLIHELKEFNPDGIIAGREKYDKTVFNECPNLKVISRMGSGVDNINLEDAKEHNITVLNTPDEPVEAVAELAVAQMLNLLRGLPNYYREPISYWTKKTGKRLSDMRVGIIGFGRIGQRVCKLLQPFECKKIYAYDVLNLTDILLRDVDYGEFTFEPLERLLHESDIVTIHIPLNPPNNENFINKELLKHMKETAYLINTSRGKVLNEKDLYDFLISNRLAGAALDVFTTEPYHGKLRELKNVFYSPHIGSFTDETRKAMEFKAFQNCIEYFKKV